MFGYCSKKQVQEMKFFAAINGISFDGESGEKPVPREELPEGVDEQKNFVFGDPSTYEKMSEAEKEELTQKMIGNWTNFTKGGGIGGKKDGL